MTKITFAPYVGPRIAASPTRLLIVGESHYGEPHSDPYESTREVVRNWHSREWAVRFLTIGARIISGQRAWEIDRHTVFAETAFYNFVQTMMPGLKHRPSTEQARRSWGAFREVLDTLDPTHILATGPGFLWSNMPPTDRGTQEVVLAEVPFQRREYLTPSGYASAVVIPHLSRASAPRWQASVREFLAR